MWRATIRAIMKPLVMLFALVVSTVSCTSTPSLNAEKPWGMVIHTGAGTFTLESLGERREPMRAAMTEALTAGHRILQGGGASLDAVEAAIRILEDNPLFNAGKGAVFTHEGTNELDSSIMNGRTLAAGAVAGLKHIKNPIHLARLVMEKSPHVMMAGEGAEAFARTQPDVELVPESYFYTERRWQELQKTLEQEKAKPEKQSRSADRNHPDYFGTVGAVALDKQGDLAAGTSTGGTTNKRVGRVGDSPVIGAGTYANNQSCGISATGQGEYFIRFTVAHDICARVQYRNMTIQAAADSVVKDLLRPAGGDGGVIGMDRNGNVAMSFNVTGMGRGYVGPDGRPVIKFTAEDSVGLPAAKGNR